MAWDKQNQMWGFFFLFFMTSEFQRPQTNTHMHIYILYKICTYYRQYVTWTVQERKNYDPACGKLKGLITIEN